MSKKLTNGLSVSSCEICPSSLSTKCCCRRLKNFINWFFHLSDRFVYKNRFAGIWHINQTLIRVVHATHTDAIELQLPCSSCLQLSHMDICWQLVNSSDIHISIEGLLPSQLVVDERTSMPKIIVQGNSSDTHSLINILKGLMANITVSDT